MKVSWSGGAGDQELKKIKFTDPNQTIFDEDVSSGTLLQPNDLKIFSLDAAGAVDVSDCANGVKKSFTTFSIDAAGDSVDAAGCTDNQNCSWRSVGAVRYILNTLFNIKFSILSREYVRAAPIIDQPYLYQGSFEYPSYEGHFRRYDVTDEGATADWDTADGRITAPNNGNSDGRKIYTAKQNEDGSWAIINFDAANVAQLDAALNVTPGSGDYDDEDAVIKRVRGHIWDADNSQWIERTNKLGAIMHSAPVIVSSNSRTGTRTGMAYVGDLYGMLHAINIENGEEKWAFIPRNLLGKLKKDRADPNEVEDLAAVDGSPTAKDIYYDHDGDGEKAWRTILVTPEGYGGNYIFALDVTDPDDWSVLWELTDTEAPGGGMGHAYRAAINKVKSPVYGSEVITGYEIKWVVFVATGYIAEGHGGINVFAFDLASGEKLWNFSDEYADAVNDIPGAVTLFDLDGDTFVDRVYVGDMNGRMWELNAMDGTNPNGTEEDKEIPLYNCGVGKPISVSPAITKFNNQVVLIFGTGGTDWASNDQAYAIYAVNVTDKQETPTYSGGAGTLVWELELDVGEKVWSAPTIAGYQVLLATAFGTMEGSNPREDLAAGGEDTGNLLSINLEDGSESWSIENIGKTRSSVYVDRQHVYMTTIDNQVIQVGDEDFSSGNANNVVLKAWRQL
jgi:hypothetical protein